MIQVSKAYLSDSRKAQIQAWLGLPGAEFFKDVIRSQIADQQSEGSKMAMSRKETAKASAVVMFKRGDDLQFVLDIMDDFMKADYPDYYTVTLTP